MQRKAPAEEAARLVEADGPGHVACFQPTKFMPDSSTAECGVKRVTNSDA